MRSLHAPHVLAYNQALVAVCDAASHVLDVTCTSRHAASIHHTLHHTLHKLLHLHLHLHLHSTFYF